MPPLAAFDVHYDDAAGMARAACVLFEAWTDARASHVFVAETDALAPYEPGSFYKRELPVLLPLVRGVCERYALSTIILDAHVWLDGGRAGLGGHLFAALTDPPEVVGVAKGPFRGSPALAVLRGDSTRALWVSSTGDAQAAAERVAAMAGAHRRPTLLTLVDHACRGLVPAEVWPAE